MSPVGSGDGGGFSFSVHHRQKENTKREKPAHTVFADSLNMCICTHCLVLLGLFIIMVCLPQVLQTSAGLFTSEKLGPPQKAKDTAS